MALRPRRSRLHAPEWCCCRLRPLTFAPPATLWEVQRPALELLERLGGIEDALLPPVKHCFAAPLEKHSFAQLDVPSYLRLRSLLAKDQTWVARGRGALLAGRHQGLRGARKGPGRCSRACGARGTPGQGPGVRYPGPRGASARLLSESTSWCGASLPSALRVVLTRAGLPFWCPPPCPPVGPL